MEDLDGKQLGQYRIAGAGGSKLGPDRADSV